MKNLFFKNGLSLTVIRISTVFKYLLFVIIETDGIQATLNEDFLAAAPEFIAPVINQTAAIGREATFSCSVSNIGKNKVGWLRASDKTIISLHTRTVIQNDRIAVKYEPIQNAGNQSMSNIYDGTESTSKLGKIVNGTWRLIIRQLKESDRGCYMCQINTSPMISQLGCLEILVSPDILNNETSADMSVVEGENATLLCNAVGRPVPRISWKREDGHPILLRSLSQNSINFFAVSIYNSSKLNLYRVDRKQMGTYLCIASNDVHPAVSKRVTLSVNFSPNVQALNQLLGAPLGTDVILECYVEAHPNTVNYWVKNPNNMLLDGLKYSIEEKRDGYKVAMRLTIKQFHNEDIGSYSCISSNSLGKVEGISRLYRIDDFDGRRLAHELPDVSISAGLAKVAQGSTADRIADNITRFFSVHYLIFIYHYLSWYNK